MDFGLVSSPAERNEGESFELRRRASRDEKTEQAGERRELLEQALGHIATQLELVRGRRNELENLEQELVEKRRKVRSALREPER